MAFYSILLLLLCLTGLLSESQAGNSCSGASFLRHINRKLQCGVFKTLAANRMDCHKLCTDTLSCFSVNMYQSDNGTEICELIKGSMNTWTKSCLVESDGSEHNELQDILPCPVSTPCSTARKALPNMAYMFNSSQFQLISLNKTWQEARSHCQTLGADLASFSSEQESRFVFEVLVSVSPEVKFGDNETFLARINMDGNDADVSLLNGAKYESTDGGVALYMDGIDDAATYPRFSFYDKSYTFGVWVKIAGLKVHIIMADDDASAKRRSLSFRILPEMLLQMIMYFPVSSSDQRWLLQSNGAIPLNKWTHIGFTFDINTHIGKIYFDGILDKSGSEIVSSRNMNNYGVSHYQIGRVTYNANVNFKGWMKDMAMIDRVLDQEEMKTFMYGERRAWIGLNDKTTEGVFQWSNGSPLTYQNKTSFNSEVKDCATMSLMEEFPRSWSMRDCQEKSYFICTK